MTSSKNPKTIELRGFGIQHEGLALAEITPGMLVERVGDDVRPYSGSGVVAPTFAQEFHHVGLTIDDVYEIGDQVLYSSYQNGSRVYALLGAGEAVVKGDKLVAKAGGVLGLLDGDGGYVVGQAAESVSNAGGADAVRVIVDILPSVNDEGVAYTYAISPATATVAQGASEQFTLTRTPAGGSASPVPGPLPWDVSPAGQGVTIDDTGLLAVAGDADTGSYTVTVNGYAGISATVTVS